MRKTFGEELYKQMKDNFNIWLICCDLGKGMFDKCFLKYPDRCINVGASEQAGLGIAVGLSYMGRLPFVYSITNFILYRPFEWIRNYLAIGQANVKLVASGRGRDYDKDGITHWSDDAPAIMSVWKRQIVQFWPKTKEAIQDVVKQSINIKKPVFISLSREAA